MERILKVAFIGAPNSGKSTILNGLIGEKVSAVTHLRNTTRGEIKGVLTHNSCQIVIHDTPGIVQSSDALNQSQDMVRSPFHVVPRVDHLCLLLDSQLLQRAGLPPIEQQLIRKLGKNLTPVTLLLTKYDLAYQTFSRERIAERIHQLKLLLPSVQDAIALSGRCSADLDVLKSRLEALAKPGNFPYALSTKTTESLRARVTEFIREQLMVRLPHELPYKIEQVTNVWKTDPQTGITHVDQVIKVPHKRLLRVFGRNLGAVHRDVLSQLSTIYPNLRFKLKLGLSTP